MANKPAPTRTTNPLHFEDLADGSAYRHIAEDADRVLRWAAVGISLTLILSMIGLATVISFAIRVAGLA